MKNKKWIFIILGIIIIGIILFFVIGMIKNSRFKDDSLIKTKEIMSTKLDNFSYNAIVSTNMYGAKFDINLDCKEDRINNLGYCTVGSNIVNLEEYLDYKNKVTYTKTDLINNDGHTWRKNEEKNMGEVTPILSTLDNIKIEKKEVTDNGTKYIGILNGKSLSGLFNIINNATSSKINLSTFLKKKIPVTVFVNNNNYVENLSFSVSIIGIEINCDINYSNFNVTPSITLPEEFNEL